MGARLFETALLLSLLLVIVPPTGAGKNDASAKREKRTAPYWGMWSSDFFGWLEELRSRAAHEGVEDLARTFWAHFPIATELGYDHPQSDPPSEE